MKQIALKLGLAEGATEQEIIAAIVNLQRTASTAEEMRKYIEENAAARLKSDDQKALFVELSKTSFKQAVTFLNLCESATPPTPTPEPGKETTSVEKTVKITDLIQPGKQQLSKENEGKGCFDYLQKHNPVELSRIKKEEPERYKELVADYSKGVRYTPTK